MFTVNYIEDIAEWEERKISKHFMFTVNLLPLFLQLSPFFISKHFMFTVNTSIFYRRG